ncbi:hypothetical protein OOK36_51590 [Streptomyces sp. NBC_00365]|uniref:hypothetical protein n=1 Tax=Streptomyces sp. NBC_00365 TaxID=2975726 RepID=UPI002256135A|nr:hypothetical protein [Streptomyces sp. NBC_00365]MCX5097004.1 hypothetical protein [Streptomyces sp. NBC_00365]
MTWLQVLRAGGQAEKGFVDAATSLPASPQAAETVRQAIAVFLAPLGDDPTNPAGHHRCRYVLAAAGVLSAAFSLAPVLVARALLAILVVVVRVPRQG